MDPITSMNFALCVVIVALAIAAYNRKKNEVALYIGVAFGLFGLSHFGSVKFMGVLLSVKHRVFWGRRI